MITSRNISGIRQHIFKDDVYATITDAVDMVKSCSEVTELAVKGWPSPGLEADILKNVQMADKNLQKARDYCASVQ